MKTKIFSVYLIVVMAAIACSGFASDAQGRDSTAIDKIAFYSGRYGNREICLVNPDGTGFQRLTNNTAHDECPSFSPDGKKIAFISNRDGNYEIYLMNPDGSNQQRMTHSPEDEVHTDWNPDATKIAFSRYTDQSHANIFVMNADGSNVQQITNNNGENMRPDWSPDGTQILFNTNKDGNYEIYLMNADGSDQQRLTNTTAWEIFPQLSPDGNRIIYARIVVNPFYGEIHVSNLDGSGDVALTQNSRSENPVWSPDGTQIAFQSSRSGNFEVYAMNSDGSDQRLLTDHSSWDGWPSWGRIYEPADTYLGQTPPGTTPEVFAPGLVSTASGREAYLVAYPGEEEIYYCVLTPKGDQLTSTIVFRKFVDGSWTDLEVAPFSGTYCDGYIAIHPDGSRLYFQSDRPINQSESGYTWNIWYVERQGDSWGEPKSIGKPINGDNDVSGPSVTMDGAMYFTLMTGGGSLNTLYRSEYLDGVYQEPERLPNCVNSAGQQFDSYIAPDESYLIFGSYLRPDTYGGTDLYFAFRDENGNWSNSINFGPPISTIRDEGTGTITPDGKYLFIAAINPANESLDIYWVDALVVNVSLPVEVVEKTLRLGVQGCPYADTLGVIAGTGVSPFKWMVIDGSLPNGLTIDETSGIISGSPSQSGTFNFTVQVTDIRQTQDTHPFTLSIEPHADEKADVNADCTINVLDVLTVVNIILDLRVPDEAEIWRADCNGTDTCDGDGMINVLDALKVINIILGTTQCP